MNPHHRGLYRSSNQAVIGGVAAGIAEHLNTDPTIIRIIFAILALFGGGLIVYLILWIALPTYETTHYEAPKYNQGMGAEYKKAATEEKSESQSQTQSPFTPPYQQQKSAKHNQNGSLIAGLFMIAIGLIFLADRFLFIGFRHLWPILLLIVGVLLIKSAYNKNGSNNMNNDNDSSNDQILK